MGLNPLLGRHTTVEVAPITFNESTGVYTIGSYTAIRITERQPHNDRATVETENINGFGFRKNPVALEVGSSVTLSEILRNQAAPSVLRTIFDASGFMAIRITENTYRSVYRCLITSGGASVNKGQSTYEITAETIEDGAANPTISQVV